MLPTDGLGGTEASGNGGLSSGTIALIVVGVVIAVIIVALAIGICLYRTRKRPEANTDVNPRSCRLLKGKYIIYFIKEMSS